MKTEPVTTNQYRIKRRWLGYEPQMQYCSARGPSKVWFPINENGYWLEPDAYNYGIVTMHLVFKNKKDADAVILKAKSANQENIKVMK